MQKTLITLYKSALGALTTLVVLLAILLVGMRVAGFEIYTVLSGSMAPQLPVGSVIYVRSSEDIAVGDVITYQFSGGTAVTHRIIETVSEGAETLYRTMGDANDTPDGSLVPAQNVVGKVMFHIPYLGYIASFISKPNGIYFLIALSAVLTLLTAIGDCLSKSLSRKESKNDKGENQ